MKIHKTYFQQTALYRQEIIIYEYKNYGKKIMTNKIGS